MKPWISAFLSRRLIDRANGHRAAVLAKRDAIVALNGASNAKRHARRTEALRELLIFARERVPFYSASVPEFDDPWAALARLPVVNREEFQEGPERFHASRIPGRLPDATGGSTGTPMQFFVNRAFQQDREASLMWADGLAGWSYGDRIAMLWGSDKDVSSALGRWKSGLRWWIENRRWYNAFDMGDERMAAFHRAMASFRPHLLVAYAGSAFAMARYLESLSRKPAYPGTAIITSAEMLTEPMRAQIERVFPARVFNRYGNREVGAIAAECGAHAGLHINEAQLIVEIDSPDPYEVPGNLLVTSLCNRAMPFIRYDTGDLATFAPDEPCSCGCGTRRLAGLQGRRSDTIRTADGSLVHGEFFTHLFYRTNRVRAFRFVQKARSRYELLLEAGEEEVKDLLPEWRAEILEKVGEASTLEVQFVDDIPPLPSGKHRFTLSELPDD